MKVCKNLHSLFTKAITSIIYDFIIHQSSSSHTVYHISISPPNIARRKIIIKPVSRPRFCMNKILPDVSVPVSVSSLACSQSSGSCNKEYLFSFRVSRAVGDRHPFRVILGRAHSGLTGGFPLLRNFSVAISMSPLACFISVLILISMFLR